MKQLRFLSLCVILLACAVLMAACSSARSEIGGAEAYASYDRDSFNATAAAFSPASSMAAQAIESAAPEAAMAEPVEAPDAAGPPPSGGGDGGILPDTIAQEEQSERKIITTYDLTVETTTFDDSITFINGIVEQYGGYVEASSVQGRSIQYEDTSLRSAHFTLRIPSDSVGQFVAVVGEQYNVIHTQESARDITDRYYDVQARLDSLEEQERQLNALLEQGGDLQYILEVHRELANVRYQIEDFYSSLQRMDQSVDYSTANITLQEVISYQPIDPTPVSFGERVGQAVSRSWLNFTLSVQDSFFAFVYNLPFLISNLLVIAVLLLIVLFIRRVIRKRRGLKRGEWTFGGMNSGLSRHLVSSAPAMPEPAGKPEEKASQDEK